MDFSEISRLKNLYTFFFYFNHTLFKIAMARLFDLRKLISILMRKTQGALFLNLTRMLTLFIVLVRLGNVLYLRIFKL